VYLHNASNTSMDSIRALLTHSSGIDLNLVLSLNEVIFRYNYCLFRCQQDRPPWNLYQLKDKPESRAVYQKGSDDHILPTRS
jgi:hypothetical protein